jgi:hypothetical protein
LRKQYVTAADRTADAQYADGVLTMRVPARDPKVLVQAALLSDAQLPTPPGEWCEILRSEDGGYAVRVFVRSR